VSAFFPYLRFEVSRLVRSWKFLLITVGFPTVFYMLFVGNHGSAYRVGGTVAWRTYLLVTMCCFGSLVAALTAGGARLSAERSSGWARQLRATPIPTWSYLVTKVAAIMLVVLPELALVEIVGASFGGVHLAMGTWLELTGLLWLISLPFALLGVFVGVMVRAETAFPVVTALLFVLGYFGGLFSPVARLPHALQVAAATLPTFHNASLGLGLLDGQGLGLEHWLVLAGYSAALAIVLIVKHRIEDSRGFA
jgi:ABC-2 type transport system permease protein